MNRSIVAVTALLFGAFATTAHAFRVIEEVENSVEIALRDVTLPENVNGSLSYRPCATCTTQTHSVSVETVYRLNGRTLSFEEFAAAIDELPASAEGRGLAGVFFDLNTKRITRLIVRVPNAQ
jgi:hypothetical protein